MFNRLQVTSSSCFNPLWTSTYFSNKEDGDRNEWGAFAIHVLCCLCLDRCVSDFLFDKNQHQRKCVLWIYDLMIINITMLSIFYLFWNYPTCSQLYFEVEVTATWRINLLFWLSLCAKPCPARKDKARPLVTSSKLCFHRGTFYSKSH